MMAKEETFLGWTCLLDGHKRQNEEEGKMMDLRF